MNRTPLTERVIVAIRSIASAAAIGTVLLVLTACGGSGTPAVTGASSATPTPTPTPTTVATVIDPDTMLVVSTTATADNGAVLHLTMQVHKSTNWDDPAAADRPALMSKTCEGELDNTVYEQGLWAFTSVSIDAVPEPGTPAWPAGKLIHLLPYIYDQYTFAPEGIVIWDEDVDAATPYCVRDMDIDSAGTGRVVIGIEGDSDAVGAAGNFTRWANVTYGFSGHEVQSQTAAEAGVAFTDCAFTVTDLGKEFNGGNADWNQLNIDTNCQIGGQP